MAMPTASVWGNWSSWRDPIVFSATGSGNFDIFAGSPRINQFNSSSPSWSQCSLGRAIEAGKITANAQIENSICVCGQHPLVSPYANIGIFKNFQNDSDNKVPYKIWRESQQINWFFAEVNAAHSTLRDHLINRNNAQQKWMPGADNNNNLNTNYYINPYCYYQFKSIFLMIKVQIITGYDQNERPQTSWISLRSWKDDHADKKICGVRLTMCGYNGYSNDVITYRTNDDTPENMQCITVCIINPVDDVVDYATYTIDRYQSFDLVHYLSTNYYDTSSVFYMTGYNMFDDQVYKAKTLQATDYGWNVWTEIPYSETNYEKILSMAALFGCPFTDTDKHSFNIDFLDNDMFLPVIPENGIAEGEYTRGSDNLDNSLYGTSTIRNINYDPSTPITPYDPNTYSMQTYFNPVLGINSMTKRYVLNGAAVEQLGRDLWTISDDLANIDPAETFKNYEDLIMDNFLTNDPISCIVGLNKYPINNIPTGTQAEPIKYGKIQGAAQGKPLETCSMFFNFTGVRIWPKFGRSFLDYEPYTHYELYIPFCGTVQIDPGDIIDHILSVQMCIDFSTGTATAYVMADNLCINTVSGSCAINIPVTGTDGVTLNSQINNGIINTKKAQGNLFLGGFLNTFTVGGLLKTAGDPAKKANDVMQGALDKAQAIYDLEHTQVPMHTIGSASPVGSWTLELDCRLMIYYPEGEAIISGQPSRDLPRLADLTEYGHTTGFSCIMQGSVSEFHGYTVGNIDTSSIAGATAEEREQIRSAFAQGVWLPSE